jgi:hypothetical protein
LKNTGLCYLTLTLELFRSFIYHLTGHKFSVFGVNAMLMSRVSTCLSGLILIAFAFNANGQGGMSDPELDTPALNGAVVNQPGGPTNIHPVCKKEQWKCGDLIEPKIGSRCGILVPPPVMTQQCCKECAGHNVDILACKTAITCVRAANVIVAESDVNFISCRSKYPTVPRTVYSYPIQCNKYKKCVRNAKMKCARAKLYARTCQTVYSDAIVKRLTKGTVGLAGSLACYAVGSYINMPVAPGCGTKLGTPCDFSKVNY